MQLPTKKLQRIQKRQEKTQCEDTKQVLESDSYKTPMLELHGRKFKVTRINMFKILRIENNRNRDKNPMKRVKKSEIKNTSTKMKNDFHDFTSRYALLSTEFLSLR